MANAVVQASMGGSQVGVQQTPCMMHFSMGHQLTDNNVETYYLIIMKA